MRQQSLTAIGIGLVVALSTPWTMAQQPERVSLSVSNGVQKPAAQSTAPLYLVSIVQLYKALGGGWPPDAESVSDKIKKTEKS